MRMDSTPFWLLAFLTIYYIKVFARKSKRAWPRNNRRPCPAWTPVTVLKNGSRRCYKNKT